MTNRGAGRFLAGWPRLEYSRLAGTPCRSKRVRLWHASCSPAVLNLWVAAFNVWSTEYGLSSCVAAKILLKHDGCSIQCLEYRAWYPQVVCQPNFFRITMVAAFNVWSTEYGTLKLCDSSFFQSLNLWFPELCAANWNWQRHRKM